MYDITPTQKEKVQDLFANEALRRLKHDAAGDALNQANKQPITIDCREHKLAASMASTLRMMMGHAGRSTHSEDGMIVKQQGCEVHLCSNKIAKQIAEQIGDRDNLQNSNN